MDLKPFSFMADPLTRKYTTLNPICTNTLKKYMAVVVKYVERKLCASLRDKFARVIDGWTEKSTHFVAVFANYPDVEATEGYSTAFSPMGEETGFTAQVHKDFLEWDFLSIENHLKTSFALSGTIVRRTNHLSAVLRTASILQ